MSDISRKSQLSAEIYALLALQNKAMQDATFMGWGAQETAAYDERVKRIAALHAELVPLEDTE